MPRPQPLYQWADRVATHFPELPATTAFVLALWSYGMVLAHSCGLDAVALHLAAVLRQTHNTLRQRLREFYQPAARKRGRGRTELDPSTCVTPLLRWITQGWTERRLALALDVTNFGTHFHVLACAVVYRGCAVPVAWVVLPGGQRNAWHPHWCALLQRLATALGTGWEVLVLTDRGLESGRLFQAITALGWHPLMRVKAGGTFRPEGWYHTHSFAAFVPTPQRRFAARGVAYGHELPCTLLACWQEGCDEPWLVLTDLAPASATACWYGFRSWIEQGFKVLKSGGWNWEQTRIRDADRASRQWVALAVATLWLIEVGGLADHEPQAETFPAWPRLAPRRRKQGRVVRVFRLGLALILAGLLQGQLPTGQFLPEAWPAPEVVPVITEQEFHSDLTYP